MVWIKQGLIKIKVINKGLINNVVEECNQVFQAVDFLCLYIDTKHDVGVVDFCNIWVFIDPCCHIINIDIEHIQGGFAGLVQLGVPNFFPSQISIPVA